MIQIFQEMNAFYWIIGVAAFTSICLLVYLMVNAFKDDEPEQPKEKPIAGGESIKYPSTHTITMQAPKRDVPNHVKYRKNVKINTHAGGTIIVDDDSMDIDNDNMDDVINATTDLAMTALDMSITQSDNTYVPDSSPVDTYTPDPSPVDTYTPSYTPDPSPSVQESWSSSPSYDSSSSHSSYDSGSSSSYDSGSSSSSSYDSSSSSFDSGSGW